MKSKMREEIGAGNDLAARIILADPVRYAGLMLMWAQLWVNREGRLFDLSRPYDRDGERQR